ncbi:helix-turn-helix domain-containing protein [Leuconostoc gasicomitatum]|uniref:helix-turn-helix domain-containing protein n=1 Tax=Leuconostoc gasicomitatum TaxID=115778 RepID=UPI001CC43353|nr:helix-turn-helix transcriptional regulator [Leuconostoc gasicomitatum]MBZ5971624.1 helix-turn-helix transcriptional regulator [Leuconostoc gasicomitatum]
MKINEKLNKLLQEKGKSWYWLGKNSGVDMSTVYRIKNDESAGTDFNTMEKIADALDVSLDEFRSKEVG